jgi:glycine oxidase
VIVIGAGVIGLSVAWRAARHGLRVLVLERERPGGGTSHVAAGMIAPVSEAVASERTLLALALASARRYPGWIAELQADAGCETGWLPCGTLMVARDGDEAAALERERAIREELGLEVRRLLPSRARELEPALAPGLRLAVEAPQDHAVDPRALCQALLGAVRARGGELRRASVAGVAVEGGNVAGVRLDDGRLLPAAAVVAAAGVWTAALDGLPPGVAAALRPVKGQLLVLRDAAGPGLLTRVLRGERCYVVPRGDGRYVLGGTVEERGFDRSVTAGALHELLESAVGLLPGVSELVVEETLAGLRPGTVDNAPLLGPAGVEGLHLACGHYRHGVLLAPISGELLGDALAGVGEVPGEFSPQRFQVALR